MALFYVMNARKEKVCNAPITLSDLSDDEIYQMTRFPRAAVNELIARRPAASDGPVTRCTRRHAGAGCAPILRIWQLPVGGRAELRDFTVVRLSLS